MSKTSTQVKDRFNAKTYDRYVAYIRKDDPLNDYLQTDKHSKAASETIKDALALYYQRDGKETEPRRNTRPKAKQQPNYTTKRQRRAAMKKIVAQLQLIRDAEEQSRDNTPDNLQNSSNYEASGECIEALESAIDLLDSAY